jgi:hypothetical protein
MSCLASAPMREEVSSETADPALCLPTAEFVMCFQGLPPCFAAAGSVPGRGGSTASASSCAALQHAASWHWLPHSGLDTGLITKAVCTG